MPVFMVSPSGFEVACLETTMTDGECGHIGQMPDLSSDRFPRVRPDLENKRIWMSIWRATVSQARSTGPVGPHGPSGGTEGSTSGPTGDKGPVPTCT